MLDMLFVCNGVGRSCEQSDNLRKLIGVSSPDFVGEVLTGYAYQLPFLSSYSDTKGTKLTRIQHLRLTILCTSVALDWCLSLLC